MDGGTVHVAVAFLHEGFHHLIYPIRKWCANSTDPPCRGAVGHVERYGDLHGAVGSLRKHPADGILVAVGFEKQQVAEVLGHSNLRQLEVVVHLPEWSNLAVDYPSASLLTRNPSVTRRKPDLLEALRKAILRVRVRRWVHPRVLESKDDLRAYFALRYVAGKELGLLTPEKDAHECQWELDYTDRTSLPLGFFAEDGSLLACGRLVRGMGEEFLKYVSLITSLIAERESSKLRKCFRYSACITHPFDVLEAFTEFRKYYRHLVRNATSKAEVSRVIVRADVRRRGLGEVVVDSLVTLAKMYGIELLFLACRRSHKGFYGRCGFQAIPGMEADRFFAVRTPVIAMDRRLGATRTVEEAESAWTKG